jgi:alpha/beta superfamily hydrolase
MNAHTEITRCDGPEGEIECAVDMPDGLQIGTAVVCHPHPLHSGTMDNKVVQTLARSFLQLGWKSVRFNFRGVGRSVGSWGEGSGEVDDALAVIEQLSSAHQPLLLAGFSFGAFVAAQAATQLPTSRRPRRLVLVGPSTEKQTLPGVPSDTVVIHGEVDEVVPLSATLDWARPHGVPVIVFPGVGHFFHGQLGLLKQVILQQLHAPS